jgi:hypothetical protein
MSGRCGGLHRPGRGAGGLGKAVVIVLAVIVLAAAGRAVAPAALTGLEITLITISGVLAAAVVAGVTVLIVLARREALARRDGTRRIAAPAVRVLPAKRAEAIEPPRSVYGSLSVHREAGRDPRDGR